ncbi:MAG: hypothetical protein AAB491_02560 [Patescibacteria group bacterium]|mgnify:CR=1 FL=1
MNVENPEEKIKEPVKKEYIPDDQGNIKTPKEIEEEEKRKKEDPEWWREQK